MRQEPRVLPQGAGSVRLRLGESCLSLFLYLDGDHRAGASMQYVRACMEIHRNDSIFVLADIHWSVEMEKTWETIRNMPEVTLSIDLFWIGILFFDPSIKVKQHYQLVPWAAKPWRLGIFR